MNTPNAFKRREIIQCAFSEHNGTKLEVHKRKMAEKPQTVGRLKYKLLNNMWVKGEISRETLKYLELNENENTS